ncbi:MAG: enoyl-CoA hydratase/isomerase family protein [Chloroflexi bacterium]|nr:enoyl-CoA hydratase/isomerase family protein [Chloroflexota bacterium]
MGLLYEKRGHLAWVTLNRPEAMNAMDPQTYRELGEAWDDFAADPEMRVAIVTGAGNRAFSAGGDLKGYAAASYEEYWNGFWYPSGPRELKHRHDMWKPVVAAINGYCLAGGLELALACDIRLAAPHATFGATEISRGLLHSTGNILMPRLIGLGNSLRYLLTGEHFDAQTALRIGLVSEIVPADELLDAAERLAQQIASNAPLAVRLTKEMAQRCFGVPLEQALRMRDYSHIIIRASEDSREGPRAFAEKRQPNYTGKLRAEFYR